MASSKATAQWEGTLKEGKGSMTPEHASAIDFSLGTRFEGKRGSNPEEVIGAALAGCFSMALTLSLEAAGAKPASVHTSAETTIEKDGDGFTIKGIKLTTEAKANGIDDAKFQEVAAATKKGCPVSKALAGTTITLEAKLVGS